MFKQMQAKIIKPRCCNTYTHQSFVSSVINDQPMTNWFNIKQLLSTQLFYNVAIIYRSHICVIAALPRLINRNDTMFAIFPANQPIHPYTSTIQLYCRYTHKFHTFHSNCIEYGTIMRITAVLQLSNILLPVRNHLNHV